MTKRKQYSVEFTLNATPQLVYSYISSPSGLNVWFADDVNILGDVLSFTWNGSTEKARIISKKNNKLFKLQWIDRSNEYLIFEIITDELTGDVALLISDHDNEDEIEEAKMVWEASIEKLKQTIGA